MGVNKNSAERTTTRDAFKPIPDLLSEAVKRARVDREEDAVTIGPRSRKREFATPIAGAKYHTPEGEEISAPLKCDYLSSSMQQGPYRPEARQKKGKATIMKDRRS